MKRFLFGLVLSALWSARGSGQTAPTDNAVMRRIWILGMDSSRTEELAHTLLDSIGPRLTGSPGFRAASDWIVREYREWGIAARQEQFGTWRGWRRGVSHIDLIFPHIRSLEGTMLAWSPGTNGVPLVGQVITLPKFTDSTEFVRWLPSARGKVVLLSPTLPTCRPSEDWARWAAPDSRARMDTAVTATLNQWATMGDTIANADGSRSFRVDSAKRYRGTGYSLAPGTGTLGARLEAAGVAAMITSRPRLFFTSTNPPLNGGPRDTPLQLSGGWGTMEVTETQNSRAPALALSCEDYGLLFRLAESGAPIVRLELDASDLGEQPAFNTIAIIRGEQKPDEYVILSAHLDSYDAASGASDNGTGTVMMMEALRILRKAYPNPKRTIIATHWAGEEQGLVGSSAFAEDHPEVIRGIQVLFNQDRGTGRVQKLVSLGLPDVQPHLKRWFDALPRIFTDSGSAYAVSWSVRNVPVPEGPASGNDGAVFACRGAPTIFMGSANWSYDTYTWHSNRDTFDKIVFDDLKHNATLVAMLAYEASEDPMAVNRTRAPGIWPADWPANCGKARRSTKPPL